MKIRLGIAVVTLLATSPVWATTVIRLTLPEMVQESELIVVGTVVGAESVWIGRELYTRYTVEVEETMHGEGHGTVPVLVAGGVDRSRRIPIGMAVAGAPTFLSRERAVLLLDQIEPGSSTSDFRIVGFNQGRFTVNGERTQSPEAAPAQRSRAAEPLDTLRARLRALIRERGAARDQGQSPRPERRR